jgi:XTP/dITP diphosphohydrolase
MSEVKFVLASNNKGKLREMREILGEAGVSVLSQSEAGIQVEPEETGTTFEENALIKARAACSAAGIPAIADDSGLAVDALGGAPGVYSARYGNCATDEERVELLLSNMRGKEQRSARFVSCIAAVFPNGDELVTRGECEGEITQSPAGENGFGYDPYFYYPPLGKSFAELSAEEKNGVSHRRAALDALRKALDMENAVQ